MTVDQLLEKLVALRKLARQREEESKARDARAAALFEELVPLANGYGARELQQAARERRPNNTISRHEEEARFLTLHEGHALLQAFFYGEAKS
jgi:hypothetical protein